MLERLTALDHPVPVDEIDVSTLPQSSRWEPRWIVHCGKGAEVGITIDDHCFLVLVKDWDGHWMTAKHIPREAAKKMSELADDYL